MQYYADKNELISFVYGGVTSASFFLYATNVQGLYNSFERDVEFIEIPGRDGELAIDNKRKKAKEIKLECFIDLEEANKDLSTLAAEIEDWLQGSLSYKDLKINTSHKTFKAICVNSIEIAEVIQDLAEILITFRVQPI